MSFNSYRHGTVQSYNRNKCRCDECRKAATTYTQLRRAKRTAARGGKNPDPLLPHGKKSTYDNWGCRCDKCTAATNAYRRELRRSRAE